MQHPDPSFLANDGLTHALDLLISQHGEVSELPGDLPETGIGEMRAMDILSGHVLGEAARLGSPTSLAHMDPPTPWITWAMALWNASLNQNMLHELTSPFATQAEAIVMGWLAPYFGMSGGHFCAGSTIANLTGIWAARDAVATNPPVDVELVVESILAALPGDANNRIG